MGLQVQKKYLRKEMPLLIGYFCFLLAFCGIALHGTGHASASPQRDVFASASMQIQLQSQEFVARTEVFPEPFSTATLQEKTDTGRYIGKENGPEVIQQISFDNLLGYVQKKQEEEKHLQREKERAEKVAALKKYQDRMNQNYPVPEHGSRFIHSSSSGISTNLKNFFYGDTTGVPSEFKTEKESPGYLRDVSFPGNLNYFSIRNGYVRRVEEKKSHFFSLPSSSSLFVLISQTSIQAALQSGRNALLPLSGVLREEKHA